MRRGYLGEYFEGVAQKALSAVEADQTRSNQHEFNATKAMLEFMGKPAGRVRLPARFLYLDDDDERLALEDAFLTLYDSRENQPKRSAEYRFYFPTTDVSEKAAEGDLLLIAKQRDQKLLVIIAARGSTAATQVQWLFGLSDTAAAGFAVRADLETDRDRVGLAAMFVLQNLGIEVVSNESSLLENMLSKFGEKFPSSVQFSEYARSQLPDVDSRDDPDRALVAWMEREELLFRTLERHLIGGRLAAGFSAEDIDGFINFSLSVQNRRKSRVGLAFENHAEEIFRRAGLRYSRSALTENRSKPDFLFPGQAEYWNPGFDASMLTMLGVKSTCKDRWRQVLAEAGRISIKHLLTLETSISFNQTEEMRATNVQLVIPRELHDTYQPGQQSWLMSVREFVKVVASRQPPTLF